MYRKILLPIFIFNFFLASGQIRNNLIKNDLSQENLIGQVKTIETKTYRVKHTSDSTYVLEDDNILMREGAKLYFNKDGYRTQLSSFDLKKESPLDSSKWIYRYDKEHRLIKKLRIHYDNPIDTSITTYKYINDSIVLRNSDIASSKHKITSDKEIITSVSKNNYKTKRLYQFDDFNRLIRYEDYDDKEFVQQLHIYTYLDTTTTNVYKQINLWPKINNDANYVAKDYDQYGNPITITTGRFDENKIMKFRMVYKYDSYGNWIERKYFNQNDKLSKISYRVITYY